MNKFLILLIAVAFILPAAVKAANWPQWRGPNGDGSAPHEKTTTTWSETKNLKWKLKLPGYGASSPIVWNDRVYLTCYSGYGTRGRGGSQSSLMRHLMCVDAKTGEDVLRKRIGGQFYASMLLLNNRLVAGWARQLLGEVDGAAGYRNRGIICRLPDGARPLRAAVVMRVCDPEAVPMRPVSEVLMRAPAASEAARRAGHPPAATRAAHPLECILLLHQLRHD